MKMETLYSSTHYWLVEHPSISQFEWKYGHTSGSSLLFPTLSVFIYLSLTLLALRFSPFLPTFSATALHRITTVHSLLLCLLSLIMAVGCTLSVIHQMPRHDWKWIVCFPTNHTLPRGPLYFWAKFFYLSKILEFIDTLLIILSNSRSRRLTFLHVYHHATVPVICYITLSSANSQSMIHVAVITNSSVHVIMYAYYFLCAMGKRPRWKRLVTNCQIFQFILNFLCGVATIYYHLTTEIGCSGVGILCFNMIFNTSLLLLFLDFRSKNYTNNMIIKERADNQKKSVY
nr:PREDICTED: elongation of fatty acids protein A-like [Nicotiana tabacum]